MRRLACTHLARFSLILTASLLGLGMTGILVPSSANAIVIGSGVRSYIANWQINPGATASVVAYSEVTTSKGVTASKQTLYTPHGDVFRADVSGIVQNHVMLEIWRTPPVVGGWALPPFRDIAALNVSTGKLWYQTTSHADIITGVDAAGGEYTYAHVNGDGSATLYLGRLGHARTYLGRFATTSLEAGVPFTGDGGVIVGGTLRVSLATMGQTHLGYHLPTGTLEQVVALPGTLLVRVNHNGTANWWRLSHTGTITAYPTPKGISIDLYRSSINQVVGVTWPLDSSSLFVETVPGAAATPLYHSGGLSNPAVFDPPVIALA